MESSPETDSDLGQSEPWVMLEDSDIEICDDPSKAKEKEGSIQEESTLNEPSKNEEEEEEEDDFAKLRKHRKFIEQLDATTEADDLSWDPSDIASSAATPVVEDATTSKTVCTRCSVCSVLLTKGGSKLASYLCNTFLALCVLAVASGVAYYFQLPNQLSTRNLKNVLARYTHPDYAMRYDKYIEPKYEKNKEIYYNEGNKYSNYQKYEDTTRKHEKKMKKERQYDNREDYKQRDYKKENREKKRYNKNGLDEKRYNRKDYEKKAHKQKKNSKSKGDYKRK